MDQAPLSGALAGSQGSRCVSGALNRLSRGSLADHRPGAGADRSASPGRRRRVESQFRAGRGRRAFTRDRGTQVNLVFGSSGTLTRQIQDGAPFEMFLAADEDSRTGSRPRA